MNKINISKKGIYFFLKIPRDERNQNTTSGKQGTENEAIKVHKNLSDSTTTLLNKQTKSLFNLFWTCINQATTDFYE